MLTVQEVLEAEEMWTKAHLNTDVEAIDRLMHPSYTIIKPSREVWGKEQALASYVSGRRIWEVAESKDHYVRIFGDTAIVIGLWRARGVNNGVPFDYSARYTSVWVKEEDRLMMVSDQSTELP